MMGYKDMTFCTAEQCVKFKNCPRALNEKVRAGAIRWWGIGNGSPPISIFAEPTKLSCFELSEKTT